MGNEDDLSTNLYDQGFDYHGLHWDVPELQCFGLGSDGHRHDRFSGGTQYHRFECKLQLFRSSDDRLSWPVLIVRVAVQKRYYNFTRITDVSHAGA